MKNITRTIGAGILALGIVGCRPVEKVELRGTVISENYQRASGGFGTPSHYSFVLDTEYGEKIIKINDSGRRIMEIGDGQLDKESIDSLINQGDRISITIDKRNYNSKFLSFHAGLFLESLKKF